MVFSYFMFKIHTQQSNAQWNVKNKDLIVVKTLDIRTEVYSKLKTDYTI